MGIKDEFHQKAILVCVSELCTSQGIQPDDSSLLNTDVYNLSEKYKHNLMEHSFSTLERCDKCNKYLRGLLHQGFICQGKVYTKYIYIPNDVCAFQLNVLFHLHLCTDCGLVAHRTCARTGLPSCLQASRDRPVGLQFKSVFGLGLCAQFNPAEIPAPHLIIVCTEELEARASAQPNLDLYTLYCSSPPADRVSDLKQKFNESTNTTSVDLTEYSPSCIASVLKKFLRELPDPVIPVQWYDRFLEASSK